MGPSIWSPPIIKWLSTYDWKSTLLDDVIAGLTVFVFLIPQGMAYAVLGGIPPVYGLYTATVPLFVYAVTGTSRHISLGPMAITSLLLGQMTSPYGFEVGCDKYVQIAICISFLTGLLTLLMGVFRLGTLSNFLSPSVLSGFMTGSSCVIALNQTKYFLGFRKMPRMTYSHEIIGYILTHLAETNGHSLWIGLLTMVLLWQAKQYRVWYKKMQKHIDNEKLSTLGQRIYFRAIYAISVVSSLLSLVIGSFIAKSLIETKTSPTLSVVGYVPAGMKSPSAQFLVESGLISPSEIVSLLPTCIILTVVGFTGNWAVCTKYSVAYKYEVDASTELVASGLANIIGPFFNCFFASGGIARSAVNVESGAQTQLSGIITGVSIIFALVFCTTWFYYIPMSILAAIIVVSIVPMADFSEMIKAYKTDRRDFAVIFSTFVITFWVGVREGVSVGLLLSISNVLVVNGFPPIVHLGQVKDPLHGGVRYRNTERFPEAEQVPGTAIVRLDAGSLFFANTGHFKEVCLQAAAGAFHTVHKEVPIEHVVLDGSSWVDIDLAGRKCLSDIKDELARKNIHTSLCNLKSVVRDKLVSGEGVLNTASRKDSPLDSPLMDIQDALSAFIKNKEATNLTLRPSPRKSISPAEWLAQTEQGSRRSSSSQLDSYTAVTSNPLHTITTDEESAASDDQRDAHTTTF